jgi:hypothetical protein
MACKDAPGLKASAAATASGNIGEGPCTRIALLVSSPLWFF